MRRNPGTVIVLASPVGEEVLARIGRSMNVTLVRAGEPADADADADTLALAAAALRQAARAVSPYALVAADPLAAVADGWRSMWDVSRPQGPAGFEQEAAKLLSAWRAGLFELPDYYLVTATSAGGGEPSDPGEPGPDFHLGPLRSVRPHRVAFVAAAEPAQQAAGILHTLGSLRPGRWWPGLDEVIETAGGFYPGRLAEAAGR